MTKLTSPVMALLLLAAVVLPAPGSASELKIKTIRLADGIRTQPLVITGDGKTRFRIVGNNAHPEKVIIDVKDYCAIYVRNAEVTVSGVELRNSGSYPQLLAGKGGKIEFSNVRFGLGGQHITARPGGRVRAIGNYDIVVGGISHLHAQGGVIQLKSNIVVTLHNAAFLAYFAGANQGGLIDIEPGVSFSGLASATKFHVQDGRINSGGLGVNGLPGGRPGVIDSLGEYDALRGKQLSMHGDHAQTER